MPTPLHIFLICALVIQSSPLCICGAAKWTSTGGDASVVVASADLADCGIEQPASPARPCLCAARRAVMALSAQSTLDVSPLYLDCSVILDADVPQRSNPRAEADVGPRDPLASLSLPRLN